MRTARCAWITRIPKSKMTPAWYKQATRDNWYILKAPFPLLARSPLSCHCLVEISYCFFNRVLANSSPCLPPYMWFLTVKNYHYLTNLRRNVCNLRDPTGIHVFVVLKINADFKLSTRWLPLAVVVLCTANSLGTVHMVFPVLQRMPKSALCLGQMLKA